MKKIFSLLVISIIYSSCSNKNNGPCDYYNYEGLAKVISIESYSENNKKLYHVGLQFNTSNLKNDVQYLEAIKGIEIDSAFIEFNKIRKGNNYIVNVSEIKEGKCTPLFVSFDFNFKTPKKD